MSSPPATASSRHAPSPLYRACSAFAALAFLAYALLLLIHSQPPNLGDFGDWTYQGVLLQQHLRGLADPAHVLKLYPVPNSLTTLGVGLLALLFPWPVAARLWLGIYLLATFLAGRHLIRATHSPALTWLLLPILFLNLNLWWGFLNFQFAVAWLLLFAALLLRPDRPAETAHPAALPAPIRPVVLGTLLCLLFFTHMIPFGFALLLLAAEALRTRRLTPLWSAIPSILLTLWYVAGRFLLAGNADSAVRLKHIPFLSSAFSLYKVGSFLKSFGLVNPVNAAGDPLAPGILGLPLYLIFFASALLLAGALLLLFIASLFQPPAARDRGASSPPTRLKLLRAPVLLFLALALVAPSDLLGIADPGARLLQTALYLLAFALPLGPTRIVRSVLSPILAGTAILTTLFAFALFARLTFSPDRPATDANHLPAAMGQLAFVQYRIHAAHLAALRAGDLRAAVFPTAMFLNLPGQTHTLAPEPPIVAAPASPSSKP